MLSYDMTVWMESQVDSRQVFLLCLQPLTVRPDSKYTYHALTGLLILIVQVSFTSLSVRLAVSLSASLWVFTFVLSVFPLVYICFFDQCICYVILLFCLSISLLKFLASDYRSLIQDHGKKRNNDTIVHKLFLTNRFPSLSLGIEFE